MKYEYLMIDIHSYDFNEEANKLGADGWQLVSVVDYSKLTTSCVFMRQSIPVTEQTVTLSSLNRMIDWL